MRQTINQTNLITMLLKKTIGILIVFLNIAGLGFLLCLAGWMLKDRLFPKKQILAPVNPRVKKKPVAADDDILSAEDDLLKDMDLSDLDNLNFDDFE